MSGKGTECFDMREYPKDPDEVPERIIAERVGSCCSCYISPFRPSDAGHVVACVLVADVQTISRWSKASKFPDHFPHVPPEADVTAATTENFYSSLVSAFLADATHCLLPSLESLNV